MEIPENQNQNSQQPVNGQMNGPVTQSPFEATQEVQDRVNERPFVEAQPPQATPFEGQNTFVEAQPTATMSAQTVQPQEAFVSSQPQEKKDPLKNMKEFVMRWLPFFFFFDFVTSAVLVITLFLPLILFSFASVWATGPLYLIWTIVSFLVLLASPIIYFMAFRSAYRRKTNAHKMAYVAIAFGFISTIWQILLGEAKLVDINTLFTIIFGIFYMVTLKEYVSYFDPSVSGEKGMNLGPVAPSKKEKSGMYLMFGFLTILMVIFGMLAGLLTTLAAGVTGGVGTLLKAPFSVEQANDNDSNFSNLNSVFTPSSKSTNSFVLNTSSFEDIEATYLAPKKYNTPKSPIKDSYIIEVGEEKVKTDFEVEERVISRVEIKTDLERVEKELNGLLTIYKGIDDEYNEGTNVEKDEVVSDNAKCFKTRNIENYYRFDCMATKQTEGRALDIYISANAFIDNDSDASEVYNEIKSTIIKVAKSMKVKRN